MRLDKFLTEVQIGSRSQVKDYIKKGRISVNQVTVLKPEAQIKENSDTVTFDGKELQYSQFHYYMLHKPAGVITAVKDDKDVTVMSLLPRDAGRNLSPVGRLDKDTEGLLLITNDGELSHRLLSPKKHVAKTYYVECRGGISESKLEMLRKGVDIGDDKMTLPAQAELIQQDADSYKIYLTITEGRFHQVKRMVSYCGKEVVDLQRLTMGTLVLDENLEQGEWRRLTKEELEVLFASIA